MKDRELKLLRVGTYWGVVVAIGIDLIAGSVARRPIIVFCGLGVLFFMLACYEHGWIAPNTIKSSVRAVVLFCVASMVAAAFGWWAWPHAVSEVDRHALEGLYEQGDALRSDCRLGPDWEVAMNHAQDWANQVMTVLKRVGTREVAEFNHPAGVPDESSRYNQRQDDCWNFVNKRMAALQNIMNSIKD